MLNLFNAQIAHMSLHRVGNRSRKDGIIYSNEPHHLSNELEPLLKEFFFKPFRDKEELYYNFTHEVDLDYNELFKIAKNMFAIGEHGSENAMHEKTKKIAQHLYDQSGHPHIKDGEVYVTYLTNITVDNQKCDAIGIFKSELLHDFLQFHSGDGNIDMELQQGIALDKLDKGCLIFNLNEETGYKILSVDSNRYDARYWFEHFLNVDVTVDDRFVTKKYMQFMAAFGKDVVLPAEDKKEQVMFNNRAVNYFAKNDQFNESNFLAEVLDNPDLAMEFQSYKIDKGEKYSIEDFGNDFAISNEAVSEMRKKIKNTIVLDTNIQIHLDFINPESAEKFVEKGWDEEKQMYYYLVYFNKEVQK